MMGKSRVFKFIFAIGFVLIVVLACNYLSLNFNKAFYETETVYASTVTNSFLGDTFVLRKEIVMDSTNDKVVNYFVEDGEKVASGDKIANFYSNFDDLQSAYELQNMADELSLLFEIRLLKGSKNVTSEILYNQITNNLGNMIDTYNKKTLSEFRQQKNDLFVSLIKKNLIYGRLEGVDERILELDRKMSLYQDRHYDCNTIYSSETGYFSRNVDGYESMALLENFLDYDGDYDYCDSLMKTKVDAIDSGKYIGKVITDFDWYVLVKTAKKNMDKLGSASFVELDYNIPDFETIPAVILDVKESDDQKYCIAILKSNYMSRDLAKLRKQKAVVSTKSFYGLIVDVGALRFVDGQRGVFVKDNKEIKFKKVDSLFETDKILVSQMRPFESEYLQMFDEVVLQGQGLYDGKIID